MTPLMFAVQSTEKTTKEVVEVLLNAGARLRTINHNRNTVLHLATSMEQPDIEIIKKLLARPDVPINNQNNVGKTALHIVASSYKSESIELMPLLLSYPNIDVNIQDKDGATPLHLAIPAPSQLSAMKSSEALLSAKIALLLTHPKINLEIQDDGGKTALDKLGELPPSFQKMVEHLKNNPEERKALQNNIIEDADTEYMEEQTSDKGNSD